MHHGMIGKLQPGRSPAIVRHLSLAALAVLIALEFTVWATESRAHAATSPTGAGLLQPYTYNQCSSGRHFVDPINVVWYGFGSGYHWPYVTHRLESWGGWTHNDYNDLFGVIPITPDYQYTVHPGGGCDRDLAQRADDCRFCNRNHVRVLYGNSSYLVGDAHHDSTVWCGGPAHISSSFDSAENVIVSFWRKHASAGYHWWGDTRTIIQCNGFHVRSSGYPAFAYSG